MHPFALLYYHGLCITGCAKAAYHFGRWKLREETLPPSEMRAHYRKLAFWIVAGPICWLAWMFVAVGIVEAVEMAIRGNH